MKKRFLSVALALLLALSLTTPALAAFLPNWNGPLGASAGPVVCDTGRDYVLYYTVVGWVYHSANGTHWTRVDRQWAEDATMYSSGLNGLAHKEFDFLWTGTEYMMRQSLLDDPRDPYRMYGDSPRNNMVTFLDADFNILGVMPFDGPVTAIRYENGTYYATVDGVEHAFTRAGWDPGEDSGTDSYYSGQGPSGRYLIRERPGDGTAFGLAISTDGRSWVPIPQQMTPDMMRLAETGGAVIYYCAFTGELWYWDGTDWAQASMPGIGTSMYVNYEACWLGDGYLVVQTATGGGMMGWNAGAEGAYNNSVLITDGQFQIVDTHDFGAPVTGLSYVDGVCYVQAGGAIYASADRTTWTATDRADLPQPAAERPQNARTLAAGDDTDGTLIYRVEDGWLRCSLDGVYFLTLRSWASGETEVRVGQGGTVLTGDSGEVQVVDRADLAARWRERFGELPTYAALEGVYIGSTDQPFYQQSGCTMAPLRTLAAATGFTFDYDGDTQTATCTRDGVTVTVRLGQTTAQVSGRGGVGMAVPPALTRGIFYVPLRFWVDAAGYTDQWDPESRTIWITAE